MSTFNGRYGFLSKSEIELLVDILSNELDNIKTTNVINKLKGKEREGTIPIKLTKDEWKENNWLNTLAKTILRRGRNTLPSIVRFKIKEVEWETKILTPFVHFYIRITYVSNT